MSKWIKTISFRVANCIPDYEINRVVTAALLNLERSLDSDDESAIVTDQYGTELIEIIENLNT
jgi:hypothetical protein